MRFAILGPLQVHDGITPLSLGGGHQRKLLAAPAPPREPASVERPPDRGAVGRATAGDRCEGAPGARLAVAQTARHGNGRDRFRRLPRSDRRRRSRRAALRTTPPATPAVSRTPMRWPRCMRRSRCGAAPRSPISRMTTSRVARSSGSRSCVRRCIERRIELELELGRHDDLVPGARGARSRAPAPRATAPPTDACPVSLRAASGGTRGLPRRPQGSPRRARDSTPATICRSCRRRSSPTTRRSPLHHALPNRRRRQTAVTGGSR